MSSVLSGMYLGVEWLGHVVIQCLTFWGTAKKFLNSSYAIFLPHQQCVRVTVSPQPGHTYFLCFKILVIFMGLWWFLAVALTCISPMINDVEHLFVKYLPILMSLEKYSSKSFAHKKMGYSSLYCKSPLYILYTGASSVLFCGFSVHFLDSMLCFSFCHLYFWCHI